MKTPNASHRFLFLAMTEANEMVDSINARLAAKVQLDADAQVLIQHRSHMFSVIEKLQIELAELELAVDQEIAHYNFRQERKTKRSIQ